LQDLSRGWHQNLRVFPSRGIYARRIYPKLAQFTDQARQNLRDAADNALGEQVRHINCWLKIVANATSLRAFQYKP